MNHAISTTSGLTARTPTPVLDALCARFRETGVMLIENLLPVATVAGMREAYAARYSGYHRDVEHDDALLVGPARHMITIALEPPFDDPDIYACPGALPLVRALLGQDAILASFVAVTSLPGAGPQRPHVDMPPLFAERHLCEALPPYCLTLVIPLVEMNAVNGTTAFHPGFLASADIPGTDPVLPDVPIGSALLFDARVWHFGTENRSDGPRPVLYNSYHRPWFRDCVNFSRQSPLVMSDADRAKVPEDLRPLFAGLHDGGG